ncbi:MAG: rod shape-determining protein MreC [Saprospiraceae bacterium]|nr:rod shape-determining protein MreC [Saprospiraceae bacterium]
MQSLLQFLFRNGVVFLFLLLEALCIYLVVQTNEKQNDIYHKSANLIATTLSKQVESFETYWKLRSTNDSLLAENAVLREQLYNLRSSGSIAVPGDTSYQVIPANVIKNSILSRNNYMTIDAGTVNGVEKGMGVISEDGPVGVVVSTTRRYATLMSLLHSNAMISAAIRNKGYFGSLVWRTANPTRMQLDAIPKHANIAIGDTVVTSGYSHLFPPDILVGVVENFKLEGGDNFFDVTVRLQADISKVRNVYVIRNWHFEEQISLETETEE